MKRLRHQIAAAVLLLWTGVAAAQSTPRDESDQGAQADAAALRIVVRSDDYLDRVKSALGVPAAALAARPVAGNLYAMVVLDQPRAVRSVDERHLKELNLTQDQAFERAIKNTLAALPPLAQSARPAKRGQIGHISGSFYDVGRVAIHAEWAGLAQAQGGTLLVALPTTDVVLYVPEDTPTAIDALRTLALNIMKKSPNPLSATILRWTNERWEAVGR